MATPNSENLLQFFGQGSPMSLGQPGAYTKHMLAELDRYKQPPSELALRGSAGLNILKGVLDQASASRIQNAIRQEQEADQSRAMFEARVNELISDPELTDEAKQKIKGKALEVISAQMYDSLKRAPEKKGAAGFFAQMLENAMGGNIPKPKEALPADTWFAISNEASLPESKKQHWRAQADNALEAAKGAMGGYVTKTAVEAAARKVATDLELERHLGPAEMDRWMQGATAGVMTEQDLVSTGLWRSAWDQLQKTNQPAALTTGAGAYAEPTAAPPQASGGMSFFRGRAYPGAPVEVPVAPISALPSATGLFTPTDIQGLIRKRLGLSVPEATTIYDMSRPGQPGSVQTGVIVHPSGIKLDQRSGQPLEEKYQGPNWVPVDDVRSIGSGAEHIRQEIIEIPQPSGPPRRVAVWGRINENGRFEPIPSETAGGAVQPYTEAPEPPMVTEGPGGTLRFVPRSQAPTETPAPDRESTTEKINRMGASAAVAAFSKANQDPLLAEESVLADQSLAPEIRVDAAAKLRVRYNALPPRVQRLYATAQRQRARQRIPGPAQVSPVVTPAQPPAERPSSRRAQ